MEVKIPSLSLDYGADRQTFLDAAPAGGGGYQGSDITEISDTARETDVDIDVSTLYKASRSAVFEETEKTVCQYIYGPLELPVQAKAGMKPNPDTIARAQAIINRLITKYNLIDSLVTAAQMDLWNFGSGYWEYTFESFPEEGWTGVRIAHRDAYSFAYTPSGKTDTDYVIGKYLKGILKNKKTGELEIWQTKDPDKQNENVQIKQNEENHGILIFKEIGGGDPAGVPYIESIVSGSYDVNLAHKRLLQAVNRAAGTFVALKLSPEELLGKEKILLGADSNTVNAAALKAYYDKIRTHGKKVVKTLSTTTSALLYPGENLISPQFNMGMDPITAHKYLKADVVQHFIPRYVVETEGNSLTSTGQSILDLLAKVGQGWRPVLAAQIIILFNLALEKNGFMDCEVTCKWPQIRPDDKDAIFNQAIAAVEQGIIPPSRARSLIGWEQLTDDEQAELEEYWAFRVQNQIA